MADLRRPAHCPLVGAGGVRMTRRGFEATCEMRHAGMTMAKSQARSGIKEDCFDCVIGDAVRQGYGYIPPAGIELIELKRAAEDVMADKVGKKVKVPAGNWKEIPVEVALKIRPPALLSYWISPPIISGMRGVCPNCQRANMAANAYGLCSTCRNVMINKTGLELLEALAAKARDLKGKKKMSLPKKAEKEPVGSVEPVADVNDGGGVDVPGVDDRSVEIDYPAPASLGPMLTIAHKKLQELSVLLVAKNADYGGGHPLGNFALSEEVDVDPFKGVMIRLGDKFSRSCNLARLGQAQVEDETIEDTLMDLAGYSLLAIAVRRLTSNDEGSV